MENNEIIILISCIVYIIGIGICANRFSKKEKCNCFGNKKKINQVDKEDKDDYTLL